MSDETEGGIFGGIFDKPHTEGIKEEHLAFNDPEEFVEEKTEVYAPADLALPFGEYFRGLRKEQRITLREFCLRSGADIGNVSKMERGLAKPPLKQHLQEKYFDALNLDIGERVEFMDRAAIAAGRIPADLVDCRADLLLMFDRLREAK